MDVQTVVVSGVLAFVGGFVGYTAARMVADYKVRLAEFRVQEANVAAGRLSRIIHRQRLVIRALKKQAPIVSKEERRAMWEAGKAIRPQLPH